MASEEELMQARRRHIEKLEEAGAAPFPNGFEADEDARRQVVEIANDADRCAELPDESELADDARSYPLYGRVMAKRGPFLVIKTPHGSAQALVRPDNLSESDAAQYKTVDLADHVAVRGPLLRTRTGALTVKALHYSHLAKALLPPPDKWHGLTDVEKRYRERYVDLFANEGVGEVFRARALILRTLRSFLEKRGFLEVETPILVSLLTGATARPFTTHHNTLDMPLYMRVAPELHLKRLVVGGFDRIYELGRTFRNEGVSTQHNPEFTMLELYMAYATHHDLIDLTEQMLRAADAAVREQHVALVKDRSFDLEAPWARVTMRQAIVDRLQRAGQGQVPPTRWAEVLNAETIQDEGRLEAAIAGVLPELGDSDRGVLSACRSYGDRVFALFELIAEEHLPALYRNPAGDRAVPVFITEHPVEVSPLARKSDADPRFVARFELFLEGAEIANAFDELNDPDDQAERFNAQLDNRARGDDEAMDFDADYVRALQHGMPPAAGLGVGVDRLVMRLTGQPSIRDVLLFPLLKPEAK